MLLCLHLEFIEQFNKIQEKLQQWEKSYVWVKAHLKEINNKLDDNDSEETKQGEAGEEFFIIMMIMDMKM